jgi:hypothetical protein
MAREHQHYQKHRGGFETLRRAIEKQQKYCLIMSDSSSIKFTCHNATTKQKVLDLYFSCINHQINKIFDQSQNIRSCLNLPNPNPKYTYCYHEN